MKRVSHAWVGHVADAAARWLPTEVIKGRSL